MKRAEDFESSARSQNPPVTFIVPPIDIPDAKILRDYIYKRFEDTWDSGGGPEVQSRTKPEWVTLTGLLDQGKPQPLALLFDTWNIFDNHQLVAYGYEGEPFSGPAFIHVYDNNNPNQEVRIAFDFTQSEMSGKLIDVAGNELTFVGDDKQVHTDYDPLKGFFCVTYTPETPPFSWGLSSGISVSPSTCQSAGAPMSFSATAANAFTFFHDSGQSTRITPVFSDPFLMQVVPANFKTDPGQDPVMTAPVPFAAAATFSQPGKFLETARLFVRVAVRRHHAIPGTPDAKFAVVNDMFGQPLTWFATLPALSSAATSPLPVTILERVKIQAVNRSASSCYYPFVEDAPVELFVANLPFSGPGITYLWEVSGAPTGPVQSPTLKILSLPRGHRRQSCRHGDKPGNGLHCPGQPGNRDIHVRNLRAPDVVLSDSAPVGSPGYSRHHRSFGSRRSGVHPSRCRQLWAHPQCSSEHCATDRRGCEGREGLDKPSGTTRHWSAAAA
jgi:hypothetical protein